MDGVIARNRAHLAHQGEHWLPQVTIRAVVDGREETLTEYLCDWPGCPNVAVTSLGVVRHLCMWAAVCAEHAVQLGYGGTGDARR
jgi:hypothetical protein